MLRALLARVPPTAPATARGWAVIGLPGLVYPGLVTAVDGEVPGVVLTGLSRDEWRVIDAYEDDLYDLTLVPLSDGTRAWAYISRPHVARSSGRTPWSLENFVDRHLADYLTVCTSWRSRYPDP